MNPDTLGLFSFPGTWEWVVILIVALLLFGRRLPDVARSLGKSIVEFKKGIRDVRDDLEKEARLEPPKSPRIEPPQPSTSNETAKDKSTAEV